MKQYTIVKSSNRNKKYDAILKSGTKVSFGAIKSNGEPYQQFRDSTPNEIYSAFNHYDVDRMARYLKRHKKDYPKYSADWFSKKYLWS